MDNVVEWATAILACADYCQGNRLPAAILNGRVLHINIVQQCGCMVSTVLGRALACAHRSSSTILQLELCTFHSGGPASQLHASFPLCRLFLCTRKTHLGGDRSLTGESDITRASQRGWAWTHDRDEVCCSVATDVLYARWGLTTNAHCQQVRFHVWRRPHSLHCWFMALMIPDRHDCCAASS